MPSRHAGIEVHKKIQQYLLDIFLLFSFSLLIFPLQLTPAEKRKGGQAVDSGIPLLSVSDPFIPLQVPDAPGRYIGLNLGLAV